MGREKIIEDIEKMKKEETGRKGSLKERKEIEMGTQRIREEGVRRKGSYSRTKIDGQTERMRKEETGRIEDLKV